MAVLSEIDLNEIWEKFMSDESKLLQSFGDFSKNDLRDMIEATDQWIEDNQGSFNQAIPLPCRTGLTVRQKTIVFCFVTLKRAEVI